MWGISAGQCVVVVLWLNLLLQKICKDLEHCFTITLDSSLFFLCVICHVVALLSPHPLGLNFLSVLAAVSFSSIRTGFGITNMEVTVLCPKTISSWVGTFTGLKKQALTSPVGNLRSWLQLLTRSIWATFLMEKHAQIKNFRDLEFTAGFSVSSNSHLGLYTSNLAAFISHKKPCGHKSPVFVVALRTNAFNK